MNFDLLLIIDASIPSWDDAVIRALRAGAGRVAVCARAAGGAELLSIAQSMRGPTRDAGAPLLVNDRLDIMQLANADGVHLKETGVSVEQARSLGAKLVGASCHDAAGLQRRGTADYCVLSPLGVVAGKNEPLGVDGFRALRATTSQPVLALGGIHADNAAMAIQAGADGIAVTRAVLAARDPGLAMRALLVAIDDGRSKTH